MASSCEMMGLVCLRRRTASRASCVTSEDETRRRSARRRKNSEDGHPPLHLSLHCDPWPLARALWALTWETRWPQWKAFFISVILFVITQQRTYSHRPLETCFHGYTDRQKLQWFLLLLLLLPPPPNTVTAYVRGYTLYCIYAMWRRSWRWVTTLTGGTGRRWIHRGSQSGPIKPALILLETFAWCIFYKTLPVSSSASSRMLL